MRLPSLLVASLLLALGCSNTGNPAPTRGVAEPATPAETPKAAATPAATTTASTATGSKPVALPTDGKCAATGLTATRMVSQGSHAGARHDLRLELDSRKLHGTSYRFDDGNDTPIPEKVERIVEAKEIQKLLGQIEKLCTPVKTAGKRQDSAPGGYTRYELIYGDKSVVAAYGAPVKPGESSIPLTRDQFVALGDAWPRVKE